LNNDQHGEETAPADHPLDAFGVNERADQDGEGEKQEGEAVRLVGAAGSDVVRAGFGAQHEAPTGKVVIEIEMEISQMFVKQCELQDGLEYPSFVGWLLCQPF